MLGLFGLIKENLEFQGKLPDKWIDWKNKIYLGSEIFKGTHLEYSADGLNMYSILAPDNKNCPVDLMKYPWSIETSIFVPRNSHTDSTGVTEQFATVILNESSERIFQLKHYVADINGGFDSDISAFRKSIESGGLFVLKIEYIPSTDSTGTIKCYCSLNRAEFELLKSFSYNAKTQGEMKKFRIIHRMHDAEAAVSGIKFVHDGKVLFERENSRPQLKFMEPQSDGSALEFQGSEFPEKGIYYLSNLEGVGIKIDWTKNWCVATDVITKSLSDGWIEIALSHATGNIVLGASGTSRTVVYKQVNGNRNHLYQNMNVALSNKTLTLLIIYEARTKTLHCKYRLSSSSSWVNAYSVPISDVLASNINGVSYLKMSDQYGGTAASFKKDSIYFAHDGEVLFGS